MNFAIRTSPCLLFPYFPFRDEKSRRHLGSLQPKAENIFTSTTSPVPSSATTSASMASRSVATFSSTRVKYSGATPYDDFSSSHCPLLSVEKNLYSAVIPEGYSSSNFLSSSAALCDSKSLFSVLQKKRTSEKSSDEEIKRKELPSSREIHDVITKADREEDWERVIRLFTGALQLQCIPFTQTYELTVWSTLRNGGCRGLVSLMDRVCTTTSSISSFLALSERIWMLINSKSDSRSRFKEGSSLHETRHPFEGSCSSSSEPRYCKFLSLPLEAQEEEFTFLMKETIRRHVLLPHRLRLVFWRTLHQNHHEKKMLYMYRKIWEELGGYSCTKKTTLLVSNESEHDIGVVAPLSFPQSYFFSSFVLQPQEMRLLLQATAAVGDLEAALLIGHHYLQNTAQLSSEPILNLSRAEGSKTEFLSTAYQDRSKKSAGGNDNGPSEESKLPPLLLSPLEKPLPDPVAVAAFGTTFFKHHADHREVEFASYLDQWMQGMCWLSNFPASDVAVALNQKMKAVVETYGKEFLHKKGKNGGSPVGHIDPFLYSITPTPLLYSFGKEHVLQLLAWSHQALFSASNDGAEKDCSSKEATSAACKLVLSLAPELQEKANALRRSLAFTCEINVKEIEEMLSYLYILEEHNIGVGCLSLPLSIFAVTFSLTFPNLAFMIWKKYPSSWWNSVMRAKTRETGGSTTTGWAFLIRLLLLAGRPDKLFPSIVGDSRRPESSLVQNGTLDSQIMQFIQLGSVLMSKLSCIGVPSDSNVFSDDFCDDEEQVVLAIETKKDILSWVSQFLITVAISSSVAGVYPWKKSRKCSGNLSDSLDTTNDFSGNLLRVLLHLLCATSFTVTDQVQQNKTPKDFVANIMEKHRLAIEGIEAFFRNGDGFFRFSPQQVIQVLCQHGVEQAEKVQQMLLTHLQKSNSSFCSTSSSSSAVTTLSAMKVAADNFSEEELRTYWGMVLAYFLQCERRCEVTASMTETIENALRSPDLLFFSESYAWMIKEWNGDVEPFRRLVWPLLVQMKEYEAAFEIWSAHLETCADVPFVLPLDSQSSATFFHDLDGSYEKGKEYIFSSPQKRKDAQYVYRCKVALSEKWIQEAILTQNKSFLVDLMLQLTSLYAALQFSSSTSSFLEMTERTEEKEHEALSIDFLTRPSTELALLFLFEGSTDETGYKLVRKVIEVFYPLLKKKFSLTCCASSQGQRYGKKQSSEKKIGAHCSSIIPSLQLYFQLERKLIGMTGGIEEALKFLDNELRPFEEKLLNRDASSTPFIPLTTYETNQFLDIRYFSFAVHCLARYGYYTQAYSFLQRLFYLRRRWNVQYKSLVLSEITEKKTSNVLMEDMQGARMPIVDNFEEHLLLPNDEDRRQFQFGRTLTCLFHTIIPMFDHIALQLLSSQEGRNPKAGFPSTCLKSPNKFNDLLKPYDFFSAPPHLQAHELCLSILFFVPILHHPCDVLKLVNMLQGWKRRRLKVCSVTQHALSCQLSNQSVKKGGSGGVTLNKSVQSCAKLLSAGAGRIGFRLLNECYFRGIKVPLSLVEVSSSNCFLTKVHCMLLLHTLQSNVVSVDSLRALYLPRALVFPLLSKESANADHHETAKSSGGGLVCAASKDATGAKDYDSNYSFHFSYSISMWRVLHSFLTLQLPQVAVEALRSLHPFHFPPFLLTTPTSRTPSRPASSTDGDEILLPSLGVQDMISMFNKVSASMRKQSQEYLRQLDPQTTVSSFLYDCGGSLRKRILHFVELNAPREAFLLLLRGLERREECFDRVTGTSSFLSLDQYHSRMRIHKKKRLFRPEVSDEKDELLVDVHLVSKVLRCVASRYPWRTTVRCWKRVYEVLPYFCWKASLGEEAQNSYRSLVVSEQTEAFQSLLGAMIKPSSPFPSLRLSQECCPPSSLSASMPELTEVIEMGITQFGLPLMSSHEQPGCQALVIMLSSQKNITISERLHCKEWLIRIRDYLHEQKVVAHMQKICEGIKRESSSLLPALPMTFLNSSCLSSQFGTPASHSTFSEKSSKALSKEKSVENDEKDRRTLSFLAPLILYSTTHHMEKISEKFFNGRWRSYELKLLLSRYRESLLLYVNKWSFSSVKSKENSNAPKEIQSLAEYVVEQLAQRHTVVVSISQLLHRFHYFSPTVELPSAEDPQQKLDLHKHATSCTGDEEVVHRIVQYTFDSLIPFGMAAELWTRVRERVMKLAQHRWNPAAEAELCHQVWQRGGTPPHSLSTAPKLTRCQIEHYWSVYHFILLPELHFDTAELCCLAYYVPELVAIHHQFEKDPKRYQEVLWELASIIHVSHFTATSTSQNESKRRFCRPRSIRAIHAVLFRARKMLQQLYHHLEMDARSTRHLFSCYGGPRHHQEYLTPTPALDVLYSLYGLSASSSLCPSSSDRSKNSRQLHLSLVASGGVNSRRLPSNSPSHCVSSRKELISMVHACGNIFSTDTGEGAADMLVYPRYIWEAVLRDQIDESSTRSHHQGTNKFQRVECAQSPTGTLDEISDSFSTSSSNAKKLDDGNVLQLVKECCERVRGQTDFTFSSSLPSWLLCSYGRSVAEALQEEAASSHETRVRQLLQSINDPVVAGLGMLHVHYSWHGKEIPIDLSQALIEHLKFLLLHSTPRLCWKTSSKKKENVSSTTYFFTPQEEDYYTQQPLCDLVALWKLFSLQRVWKSIHLSRRKVFWYLLSPTMADIEALPSKATRTQTSGEKKIVKNGTKPSMA